MKPSSEMNDSIPDMKTTKPRMILKPLDSRWRYFSKNPIYFTNREHAVVAGKLHEKPPRQFCVPRSEKLLSYIRFSKVQENILKKHRLAQPVRFKDNRKTADMRNVSSRLYVKEPPDKVKTVVEIHPDFFNAVQGRPMRNQNDIKVYIENLRNYGMLRQQIGYRYDIMQKLKKDMDEEFNEYFDVQNDLRRYTHSFSDFLTEDYKKATLKMCKTDRLKDALHEANITLLAVASEITRLNNQIYQLDAITNVLKVYRRFLIFGAPLPWRQLFDETLKDRSESFQFTSDEFVNDNEIVNAADIDKILEEAKSELKSPPPACMYFEKPEEMMYLFRSMELQSREYLIEYSKHSFPITALREKMKRFINVTKLEQEFFKFNIDQYNDQIERECYNEIYLQEKFNRILTSTFYESVASEQVLKLKNCIEYVYEQIFGPCEEGHRNLREPMRILEVDYEEYNNKLDALDFNIVKVARNEYFKQDLTKIAKSLHAQRELKSFRVMTNAMKKAFFPPAKFKRPVFKKMADNKARQNQEDPKRTSIKTRTIISANERDALLAFTDWCEGFDPTNYLKEYYEYVEPVFTWELGQSSSSSNS